MKKLLLFLAILVASTISYAQATVVVGTLVPYANGTMVEMQNGQPVGNAAINGQGFMSIQVQNVPSHTFKLTAPSGSLFTPFSVTVMVGINQTTNISATLLANMPIPNPFVVPALAVTSDSVMIDNLQYFFPATQASGALCNDGNGNLAWGTCGGGGGSSPGGTGGAMQYNLSGGFGGLNGTGIVKLNGASAPTIASAGTDYLAPNGSSAALSVASSSAFGVAKCDNSTITCAGGVFTSVGGGIPYPSGTGIPVVSAGAAWGTTVAAPTGTIVGTTDAQALTSKSVNGVTLNGAGSSTLFLNQAGGYSTPSGTALTIQTNSANNASQTALNFVNPSTFNGLTITFSNPSTSTETFALGGTLGNAGLTNSSVTIGSTPVALGATVATFAGMTLTGATVNGVTLSSSGSSSLFLTQAGTYASASGSGGTVTHTVGALTAQACMIGNGTADSKVDPNCTLDGSGNMTLNSVSTGGTTNGQDMFTYIGTPATAPTTHQFQISPALDITTPWSYSPAPAPATGFLFGTNTAGVVQGSFVASSAVAQTAVVNTFTAAQIINLTGSALPAPPSNTLLTVANVSASGTRIVSEAFGGTAYHSSVAYGGTVSSPTAVTAATELGGFNAFAYNGTALNGPVASFRTYANQNQAVGSGGSYADIATTPNGSTTLTEVLKFENDGGMDTPGVTGGDKGTGTLNVAGLYVNGTAVGASGFPIVIGSTSIATGSTTTTIAGLTLTGASINGVTLTTGGSSTTFLNGAGSYTTPSVSGVALTSITAGAAGTNSITNAAASYNTWANTASASPTGSYLTLSAPGDTGSSTIPSYLINESAASARTGPLFQVNTLSGSTESVINFCTGGTSNCIRLGSTGNFAAIGTAQIIATQVNANTYPASAAGHAGGLMYASSASAFTTMTAGTAGQLVQSNGASAPTFTSTPVLGLAGTTLGTLGFQNLTSGTITLEAVTGALGTVTALLPANSGTIAELNLAQSWTATQTFTAPVLGAATATSLLATGNVDGTAPVTVTTGTTATLGGTFKSGYTWNQEATAATAVAYTLPTAAAGLQYCVGNGWNGSAATTGVLTVNASASGQFIIFTDGTLSATGGNVTSGGAAADFACFVGVDTTHWQFKPSSGAWSKH